MGSRAGSVFSARRRGRRRNRPRFARRFYSRHSRHSRRFCSASLRSAFFCAVFPIGLIGLIGLIMPIGLIALGVLRERLIGLIALGVLRERLIGLIALGVLRENLMCRRAKRNGHCPIEPTACSSPDSETQPGQGEHELHCRTQSSFRSSQEEDCLQNDFLGIRLRGYVVTENPSG